MEELQTTFFGSKCIKQRYKLSTKYDEEPSGSPNPSGLPYICLEISPAWESVLVANLPRLGIILEWKSILVANQPRIEINPDCESASCGNLPRLGIILAWESVIVANRSC